MIYICIICSKILEYVVKYWHSKLFFDIKILCNYAILVSEKYLPNTTVHQNQISLPEFILKMSNPTDETDRCLIGLTLIP